MTYDYQDDFPPCDVCGGPLTKEDREALTPDEWWAQKPGDCLCVKCDACWSFETKQYELPNPHRDSCHACGTNDAHTTIHTSRSPGEDEIHLCEHCT